MVLPCLLVEGIDITEALFWFCHVFGCWDIDITEAEKGTALEEGPRRDYALAHESYDPSRGSGRGGARLPNKADVNP